MLTTTIIPPCPIDTIRLLLRCSGRCRGPGPGTYDRLASLGFQRLNWRVRRSRVTIWVRPADGLRVEQFYGGVVLEFSVPRLLRGGNHLLAGITEQETADLLFHLPEQVFPGLAKRARTAWVISRLDLCVDFDGPVRTLARAMRYARWGRVLDRRRQKQKGPAWDPMLDGPAVRWVRGSAKAVRLQMYHKGVEMVQRGRANVLHQGHGRWELLLRQPGNRKWAVKALSGDASKGPRLLLDAGPHAEPVAVPLDFARLRALVIGEVASIEDGVGVPMKKFRNETMKRFREMAHAPMWTTNGKRKGSRLKARERMVLQRRQAYVLAIHEGLVERATGFMTLAG